MTSLLRLLKNLPAALVALALPSFTVGSDAWRERAPLPTPRSEVAAAVVSGEIAVVGGFLADRSSSREVDAYSPAADSWLRLPDLPAGVNHAAAACVHRRLYVFGGAGAERSVFVLVGGRWRTLSMPVPRVAAGAVALGGRVYIVGGIAESGLAHAVLAFDTQSERWQFFPSPTPRQHLAVAVARGRIYAIAGRTTGYDTNMALVQSWAPGERRWRREAPVPEPRGGTGAATVGGSIVSVGGEAPSGTLRAVYAYDVIRRRWGRLTDLPTPRHGLAVVAVGGVVYAIGGGTEPGLSVSSVNESLRIER